MTDDERALLVQVAFTVDQVVTLLAEKFNFEISGRHEYRNLVDRVNKTRSANMKVKSE